MDNISFYNQKIENELKKLKKNSESDKEIIVIIPDNNFSEGIIENEMINIVSIEDIAESLIFGENLGESLGLENIDGYSVILIEPAKCIKFLIEKTLTSQITNFTSVYETINVLNVKY